MLEEREDPAEFHQGLFSMGHEEGGRAHLGNLLVLQRPGEPRKGGREGQRAVPWSPSVLVSRSS